ncbi:transcriptional repressor CTCF [Drosophila rhopaloa]|uniref:Transcriptional repressor CTCF n=1 Tax=Drosophila rhopaloa TaxID=1041015 RepID=A0A6P4FCS0_DRORH|nr:transcriptional repressor CTCF [Drosophila rhopaloa]XP_016987897.1 transcriptional repressor CTCF [Drosophila rhopaloa]
MPRRGKKDEDSEDLQSFLSNFHKEIEGSSDDKVVHTILKAIRAEDGDLDEEEEQDAEAGKSKPEEEEEAEEDAEEEDDDDDDEDKYFIDDEGNCYIKTTPKKQKELQKKLKQAAARPGRPTRSVVSKATNKAINLRPAKSPPKAAASKTSPERKPISVRPARAAAVKSKQIDLPPPAAPAPKVPATRGRPRKNPVVPKLEPMDLEREIEELVDDPDISSVVSDLADYAVDSAAVEAATSVLEPNENEVYDFEDSAAVETADDKKDLDYVVSSKEVKLKPAAQNATASGNKYSCPNCPYTANKKFLISRHCRNHDVVPSFKCSICERSFRTNVSLQNHVNTHMGKKPHKCKSCESAFTTSGELIRHTRYKHTKEKPHKCTECSYASVELTKLRRHMTCHTGERPFQCPHCTYASQDMFKLKRHLVIHTGEKKYQCDICKSRFTQSNSLKAHKLIHSVVDKPVFQCTLCPTTCGRKADLRIHIKHMHTSDQPLSCRRCGQQLPDRYQYKLHVKSHEGEKCYRCTLCSYASVTQRHLDSHMLIHLDEKPFQCGQCPQAFRQRQLLRRHMNLIHNEEYTPPEPRAKMHKCPTCSREFTHKGNLMRHMEMHDNSVNAREKQRRLKMGRNLRLQKDGTVVAVVKEQDFMELDEDGDEDNPESYDLAEIEPENSEEENIEEEEILPDKPTPVIINKQARLAGSDNQPTIINRRLRAHGSTKTFHIKEEPDNSDFTVELQDGGVMVVELVNGDEEVVVKREPSAASKISASNCFGFEEDDDFDEFPENEVTGTSQEFLQLMDMIEQDT